MPPRTPGVTWRHALLAAVAVHALLLTVRILGSTPKGRQAAHLLLPIVPLADSSVVRLMPYLPQPARSVPQLAGPVRRRPTVVPEQATKPAEEPPPELEPPPLAKVPPIAETPPAKGRPSGGLRPALGGGVLWVRPMPLPPAELAARLRPKSHMALVDSAVHDIVEQYLDSIANDPTFLPMDLPSWVGKVGGQEFGLDGNDIIVAGLRIPAAILGFLPLSIGGGTIDPNRSARRTRDMRDDLVRAAQRAENHADFKRAITEIRERKQAEREFERNQRTTPLRRDSLEMMQ